jgi:hypothetical protein
MVRARHALSIGRRQLDRQQIGIISGWAIYVVRLRRMAAPMRQMSDPRRFGPPSVPDGKTLVLIAIVPPVPRDLAFRLRVTVRVTVRLRFRRGYGVTIRFGGPIKTPNP